MWLAEVLLLSIETGENLGTNTGPIFSLSLAFFRGNVGQQFREGFRDPSHY